MRTLIVQTAVMGLVMLTVGATIKSLTAVAPKAAAAQGASISPAEIQRQTDANRLPVAVIDQPY